MIGRTRQRKLLQETAASLRRCVQVVEQGEELAAEELQHIGTLPRLFARMHELVLFLTQHWLRLVEDNGSASRMRPWR